MPTPIKLDIIQAVQIGGVDEPDFVKKSMVSDSPSYQRVKSSLHSSASLDTFEPSDDDEEEYEGAAKKKKKSNKGMLIAGAAAIAVLALRK